MLLWATEFPIRSGCTSDDVLLLAKKWLIGSPHATWLPEHFVDEVAGVVNTFNHDGQCVETVCIEDSNDAWSGLRHSWTENKERYWITEIVAHQTIDRVLVSIQVQCELLRPGLKMPRSRKPYIVKQMLDEIGGGIDGGLLVSDRPTYLQETEVGDATKLILGKRHNHLPIIYASAKWNGEPAIDAVRLAQWASGMAHVVVEPSRFFSFALARSSDRQNAYGGAVSVYWPGQGGNQARLLPTDYASPARLATAVADLVRQALVGSRPTPECTWDHLLEKVSVARLESLRASGSQQVDEYIKVFDSEIAAKDARIQRAESEIMRLKEELQRIAAAAHSSRAGIIKVGKEQQFYADEAQDVVIKALERSREQFFREGRCRDIIEDILSVNTPSGQQAEIEEEIKSALNPAKELGKRERKALEQIGFKFTNDGKHIKAIYHSDPRYTFIVQKTGSDWRGMRNLASEICRKLFK